MFDQSFLAAYWLAQFGGFFPLPPLSSYWLEKSGLFWSISLLHDPDPHFHYGSGSRGAKSVRIRIPNTGVYPIYFVLGQCLGSDVHPDGGEAAGDFQEAGRRLHCSRKI